MTPTANTLTTVRVLLLDDHRVFSESLAMSLETHAGLRCVALAHTVEDGLRAAETTAFDVVLLDLELPDGNGFATIDGLLALRPDAKVVVLTAHLRPDLARRALAAGATGFLSKSAGLSDIIEAVHAAYDGRETVGIELDTQPGGIRFTPREQEVLLALSQGLDAGRIASTLGISLYTARDHIRAVMVKLDVRTQLDAVITADRLGLITLGTRF